MVGYILYSVAVLVITAEDVVEPPLVTPPSTPLHPNPSWPTLSGINETEAKRICQTPILESDVFSVCSNFTAESFDFVVNSCVLDIQVLRTCAAFFHCISSPGTSSRGGANILAFMGLDPELGQISNFSN